MRIAICFSGQIRTGVQCVKNILNFISNDSFEIDYFIHTWDIETDRFKHTKINVTDDKINDFTINFNPKKIKISNFDQYQNEIQIQIPTFLSIHMFQSIYECNKLKQEYEIENNFKYDYVVRIRPDTIFYSFHKLQEEIEYITGYYSWSNKCKNVIYTCDYWNKLPGAMEDIFWISTSDIMDVICDDFKKSTIMENWQVSLSNRIYNTLDMCIKPLKYNNIEIYRYDSDFSSNDMLKLN